MCNTALPSVVFNLTPPNKSAMAPTSPLLAQSDQRVFHLCIPPLLGRIDMQPLQVPGQGLHT